MAYWKMYSTLSSMRMFPSVASVNIGTLSSSVVDFSFGIGPPN